MNKSYTNLLRNQCQQPKNRLRFTHFTRRKLEGTNSDDCGQLYNQPATWIERMPYDWPSVRQSQSIVVEYSLLARQPQLMANSGTESRLTACKSSLPVVVRTRSTARLTNRRAMSVHYRLGWNHPMTHRLLDKGSEIVAEMDSFQALRAVKQQDISP